MEMTRILHLLTAQSLLLEDKCSGHVYGCSRQYFFTKKKQQCFLAKKSTGLKTDRIHAQITR